MRLLGIGETFDATNEESIGHRVFEYDTKANDYMYNFSPVWEICESDYLVQVGNQKYHLPSGAYVLVSYLGCDQIDWIVVDELINMDIEVVQMSNDLNTVSLKPMKLVDVDNTLLYFPQTKNPFPISDISGTRSIVICFKDVYHGLKHLGLQDFCSL